MLWGDGRTTAAGIGKPGEELGGSPECDFCEEHLQAVSIQVTHFRETVPTNIADES